MQGTRALLGLVIAMGVMIVLGTTGLIAVVVHRLAHPQPALHAALVVPDIATPVAAEPAGTRITAMVRQTDTLLAIALTGGGPDRVLVWDLGAGRKLAEIPMGR